MKTRSIIPRYNKADFFKQMVFGVKIFIRSKKNFDAKNMVIKMYEQARERWVHAEDTKLDFKDALQIPLMLFKI